MDAMPENGESLTPEIRVSVALTLRGILEDWLAADTSRTGISTPIWNDLQTADIPDDDEDADKALNHASRQMILNGMLTSRDYDGIVTNVKAEMGQ